MKGNPDASTLCVTVITLPNLCIPFPGGAQICAQGGTTMGDPLAAVSSLFGAVNAALAPMAPVFNVIQVALQIFKCIQAIPKCFTSFPPGPQPIIECIAELIPEINKLLQLIPELCIPAMVKATLTGIITFIKALENKLKAYLNRLIQINAGYARAQLLPPAMRTQLKISLDCAAAALHQQQTNMAAAFTPVNQLIQIISAFMQLAGLGCVPALGAIGPLDDKIFEPLDAVVELLTIIRDAIPDLSISLMGGSC